MMPLAIIPGHWEWVIVGLAVLLLFGGRKLPELARAMGSSISQFKSGLKDGEEQGKIEGESEAKEG